MRKQKMYIAKKKIVKNNIGEVESVFEDTKISFWVDYLLPVSNQYIKTIKEWGFDPNLTMTTTTRADVGENIFVRANDETFHIQKIERFPRHNTLFLERVEADG